MSCWVYLAVHLQGLTSWDDLLYTFPQGHLLCALSPSIQVGRTWSVLSAGSCSLIVDSCWGILISFIGLVTELGARNHAVTFHNTRQHTKARTRNERIQGSRHWAISPSPVRRPQNPPGRVLLPLFPPSLPCFLLSFFFLCSFLSLSLCLPSSLSLFLFHFLFLSFLLSVPLSFFLLPSLPSFTPAAFLG